MLILSGAGKVYEFWPAFRAESSFSSRHQMEPILGGLEIEGVHRESQLIALERDMLRAAMAQTIASMRPELKLRYPRATMPGQEKVMTFAQAQTVLGLSGEESLSAEQERRLGSIMMEQGYELVALTQLPWKQHPFYHMKEEVGGELLTRIFELIYRGLEITTGAIRERRYEVLMAQLAEKGLSGKGMEFYLESFNLGAPPHAASG